MIFHKSTKFFLHPHWWLASEIKHGKGDTSRLTDVVPRYKAPCFHGDVPASRHVSGCRSMRWNGKTRLGELYQIMSVWHIKLAIHQNNSKSLNKYTISLQQNGYPYVILPHHCGLLWFLVVFPRVSNRFALGLPWPAQPPPAVLAAMWSAGRPGAQAHRALIMFRSFWKESDVYINIYIYMNI